MHNELTKMDLKKMQEELDYRRITLRPQLLEEVKVARSFGDLSENFEYKAAKRDKNKNESRIRFLENMIKTAVVIEDHSASDTVGLYDKVTVYLEEDGGDLAGGDHRASGRAPRPHQQGVPHGGSPHGEAGGRPFLGAGEQGLWLLRRGPRH